MPGGPHKLSEQTWAIYGFWHRNHALITEALAVYGIRLVEYDTFYHKDEGTGKEANGIRGLVSLGKHMKTYCFVPGEDINLEMHREYTKDAIESLCVAYKLGPNFDRIPGEAMDEGDVQKWSAKHDKVQALLSRTVPHE